MPTEITPADRHAIFDTLYRYAYCLDTADGEGLAATFTRDGVVASPRQSFTGHDALVEFTKFAVESQPGFFGRQHHVQPVLVEPLEDGCRVISYWQVVTWPAGGESSVILMGWYEDMLVKEAGEWRIRRKYIDNWNSENAPIVGRPAKGGA